MGCNSKKGVLKKAWTPYIKAIQDYIGGLNWAYKVELRDKTVKYINAYGYIQDANTVKTTNKRGKVSFFNLKKILNYFKRKKSSPPIKYSSPQASDRDTPRFQVLNTVSGGGIVHFLT